MIIVLMNPTSQKLHIDRYPYTYVFVRFVISTWNNETFGFYDNFFGRGEIWSDDGGLGSGLRAERIRLYKGWDGIGWDGMKGNWE